MLYVTVDGHYRLHAERHEERARWHEGQGHPPEWAAGSRRKAARWRRRAREYAALTEMPHPRMQPQMIATECIQWMAGKFAASVDKALFGPAA